MPQYIFIVAYDGTRFHGFQRQYSNSDTSKGYAVIEGMKKRPRIDQGTGERLPMTRTDSPKQHHQQQQQPRQYNHKTVTVQECLEYAILQWISTVTPDVPWSLDDLNLRVAGRTDKGVHARGQVIAVQFPNTGPFVQGSNDAIQEQQQLPLWKIQKGIHGRLPIDISFRRVYLHAPSVNDANPILFDPRHDAKLKRYSYTIKYQRRKPTTTRTATQNNASITPIIGVQAGVGSQTFRTALDDSPCLWLCQDPLDDRHLLPTVCRLLAGTHDYSAFVHKAARHEKDNTLTITRLDFEILQEYELPSLYLEQPVSVLDETHNIPLGEEEPQIVLGRFIVEGQRFRRTMVRNLVGFAVDVAKGKEAMVTETFWTTPEASAKRVHSAPPTGLCLEFVRY